MLIGVVAIGMGLLFIGQGLGYVRWPASSFMLSQIRWAYYGGAIATIGLALVIVARR